MLASSQPLLLRTSRLGPRVRQAQLGSVVRAVVMGIAVYGAVAPLLAIVHELIVLGTAHLVGDVAWLVATGGLLRAVPLDPIYTSAMLLTLGGIEPRGLALAGPAGALLHDAWPGFVRVAGPGRDARLGQRHRRAGLHRRQSLALRHRRGRRAHRGRAAGDAPGSDRAALARRLRRHRPGSRRRHPPDRGPARACRRRGGRHPVRRRDDRLRRRPGRPAPRRDPGRHGRPAPGRRPRPRHGDPRLPAGPRRLPDGWRLARVAWRRRPSVARLRAGRARLGAGWSSLRTASVASSR